MDIEKARRTLAARIATMNALRGRPLTAVEKLENIEYALSCCDQCDRQVELSDISCPWCGYQLR